ncbi:MAG: hypothetical protein EHM19_10450 [Candidatus Latescibacterota bacterium]|nr:MAG: hypothetical protein EHM19_10450 [Candidatus Latescibacterota bacterium]
MNDRQRKERIPPGPSALPVAGALARNTVISFVGQIVPLLVGLATIPYVIGGLGVDRFGVLALTWSLLGYVGFLQLGLGPAVTKYAAEMLGRGDLAGLPRLLASSLVLSSMLGILACVVLAVAAPFLAGTLFRVPADLVPETRTAFLLLAAALPFVFVSGALRGFLIAAQEFGVVTVVGFVTSSLNYLAPVAAIVWGGGLASILLVILCARAAGTLVLYGSCVRRFHLSIGTPRLARSDLSLLLRFGGWISVTNATGPLLAHLERLVIAGLLSVGLLTYYATPFEMVSRITVLPASFALTLFPAVSFFGQGNRSLVESLFARSLKWLLFLLLPIVVLLIAFADLLLALWLGEEFAAKSAGLLRILAVSFFLNALAHIPLVIVQGFDRPDIKAKLDFVEVPIFAGLLLLLVRSGGLEGAALAKLFITMIDTFLLFFFAKRILGRGSYRLSAWAARRLLPIGLAYGLIVWGGARIVSSPGAAVALALGMTVLYLLASWRLVMDARDRDAVRSLRSLLIRGRVVS